MLNKALILALVCALSPWPALACTLWGAAGAAAAGGGTLISKNRDWAPDHRQVLKKVRPAKGFAYLGLFAEGNGDPGLKAGVNAQGLTIVSAASSSLARSVRADQPGMHGVMVKILTDYASVDALVADADKVFSQSRANFFLVSDHSKVLTVEVGLHGIYALSVTANGTTTHTNHYLDPALASAQPQKAGESSRTRYQRINALLGENAAPYTLALFSTLARDQHDGPENSLWRKGREYTLASWIVATPAQGAPRLHLVVANPGEAEVVHELLLDAQFWQ
ncbi:carcinine hydrolase/isopenicillin-N N-acyltransferase family protein [Rhodoferax sp.]|uniref:carcinine hydrolase/isopenicillin-N N-acyltransferase family protein n=1 Tax=Rhodoferax sp. TaxID=50421 RepID=UPI0025FA1C06|nr:carcinine hydrolase/isopenicillin-N N-acyltransferase family protein [Rhodoferax sp.]